MIANIISIGITAIITLNIFLAIVLIFLERRDASSTWAWLMVLFFIPILGFLIYLLLGRQLRKKHLFRWEGRDKIGIDKLMCYFLFQFSDSLFTYFWADN